MKHDEKNKIKEVRFTGSSVKNQYSSRSIVRSLPAS